LRVNLAEHQFSSPVLKIRDGDISATGTRDHQSRWRNYPIGRSISGPRDPSARHRKDMAGFFFQLMKPA
jgi:hypothetical protein